MTKTYVVLNGDSSNNSRVLQYATSLGEAKHVLETQYNMTNSFILMIIGTSFGDGLHRYTLELVNGKYKRNTRL
jgi:hypothetical protein